jgi:hypothetical protein
VSAVEPFTAEALWRLYDAEDEAGGAWPWGGPPRARPRGGAAARGGRGGAGRAGRGGGGGGCVHKNRGPARTHPPPHADSDQDDRLDDDHGDVVQHPAGEE